MDTLASLHNEGLIKLFEDFDLHSCSDCKQEAMSEMAQVGEYYGLSHASIDSAIANALEHHNELIGNEFGVAFTFENKLRDVVLVYISDIEETIRTATSYAQVTQGLVSIQLRAMNAGPLTCVEKEIV
jgi:hypothetical protein